MYSMHIHVSSAVYPQPQLHRAGAFVASAGAEPWSQQASALSASLRTYTDAGMNAYGTVSLPERERDCTVTPVKLHGHV